MGDFSTTEDSEESSDLFSNSTEEADDPGIGHIAAAGLGMGEAGQWMGAGINAVTSARTAKIDPTPKPKSKWSMYSKTSNKKKAPPPRPSTPAPQLPGKQGATDEAASNRSEVESPS